VAHDKVWSINPNTRCPFRYSYISKANVHRIIECAHSLSRPKQSDVFYTRTSEKQVDSRRIACTASCSIHGRPSNHRHDRPFDLANIMVLGTGVAPKACCDPHERLRCASRPEPSICITIIKLHIPSIHLHAMFSLISLLLFVRPFVYLSIIRD